MAYAPCAHVQPPNSGSGGTRAILGVLGRGAVLLRHLAVPESRTLQDPIGHVNARRRGRRLASRACVFAPEADGKQGRGINQTWLTHHQTRFAHCASAPGPGKRKTGSSGSGHGEPPRAGSSSSWCPRRTLAMGKRHCEAENAAGKKAEGGGRGGAKRSGPRLPTRCRCGRTSDGGLLRCMEASTQARLGNVVIVPPCTETLVPCMAAKEQPRGHGHND